MKKLLSLSMFLFASITALGQQSADDAIKATVTNYFEGVTTGDAAKLNKAFHESAILRTFNAATERFKISLSKLSSAKLPLVE